MRQNFLRCVQVKKQWALLDGGVAVFEGTARLLCCRSCLNRRNRLLSPLSTLPKDEVGSKLLAFKGSG
jgi:hypothetical protein